VRTEEKLLYSNDRFKTLFEYAPDAYYISDIEGVFIDGNLAAEKLVGFSREDLIGRSFLSAGPLNEKDIENAVKLLDNNRRGLATGPDEFVLHRQDGVDVPIEIRTFPVILDGKHVVLGIARDITEHKKKEAVQYSDERYHKVLADNVTDLVWTTDMGLRFTYISPTVFELGGYSVEEAMNLSLEQILKPDSLKVILKTFEEELAMADVVGENLYRSRIFHLEAIKKDGSTVWLEAVITFLRDRSLLPCGTLGVANLADERSHKNMLLGQVSDQTSNLLSYSPNPILTLSTDSTVGYVNTAFEELTGYKASEVIGLKPPYPWWTAEHRDSYSDSNTVLLRENAKKFDQLYCNKKGQQFWVNITPVKIEVKGTLIRYLEYWIDITEQKRIRENMTYYISQITKAQEEERWRIANELGNNCMQHLSSLSLSIDNLSRKNALLPHITIGRIKQARKELNGLMGEMRSFLHQLRPGVIDELGLVPALESLIDDIFKNSKIEASILVAGTQRRMAIEIELNLYRIAQEALRNIVKHSGATQVKIRLTFKANKTRLTMSDNGKGFKRPVIIREFANEDKFGLIGIQERTRLLDTDLMIKTRINRGTTIIVEVKTAGSKLLRKVDVNKIPQIFAKTWKTS